MTIEKLNEAELSEIAIMLKALSDPTRLKIMQALHEEELCVSDIVKSAGTGQANISKHLQILSRANLIKSRREGSTVFYSLFGSFVEQLCESICKGYTNIITKKFGKIK